MRRVIYLLGALLFLSCSGSTRDRQQAHREIITPQTISYLLSEKPEDQDAGLFLYRNPLARPVVENFYLGLTGDPLVAGAILTAAADNDIPLPLAFSLAWVESSFKIRALNRNRNSVDRGLFQLNSRSFPRLNEEQFYDPRINARYGLAHLRYCLEVSGDDEDELVALAMYNAGIAQVRRGTPYPTLRYVSRILDYELFLRESFDRLLADTGAIAEALAAGSLAEDS